MNAGLISSRYATALLEFAKESKTAEKVYDEAILLTEVLAEMSELRRALESPVLQDADKKKLLLTAAGGKPGKTMERFIELLIQNKREAQIQFIMLKFIDLYRADNNIRYGKLITAFEIDQATETRLKELVTTQTGATLELEKKVDPEVLGGFSLEVDQVLWDATLRRQLNQLRQEFTDKNKSVL